MRWTIPATGMYLKLPAGGNYEPMVFDNTKGNANYKQQVLLNALVGTVFTCPPTLNQFLRTPTLAPGSGCRFADRMPVKPDRVLRYRHAAQRH